MDEEMTVAEFEKLQADLKESGWERHLNHNDAGAVDACPICSDSEHYYIAGLQNPKDKSEYRCFVVCQSCGHVTEF